MASANQTPGGYKFAPLLVASQQDKGEQTGASPLALGYPLLGPSRQFSKHHGLRLSHVLHARHKSREQGSPPPAHGHHDITCDTTESIEGEGGGGGKGWKGGGGGGSPEGGSDFPF